VSGWRSPLTSGAGADVVALVGARRKAAEKRAIINALATSPVMGAFTVAVGQLGLDGAVLLCQTRTPSPRLLAAWGELGYRLGQLPTSEDIRLFLLGVEIKRRLSEARQAGGASSIKQVLFGGLCSPREAKDALHLLKSYGGIVELSGDGGHGLGSCV